MSRQDESDRSSLPILHFINKSNKAGLPSNQKHEVEVVEENKTESTTLNDIDTKSSMENNNDEKPITTVSHSRRVHFPTDDSQLRTVSYAPEPLSNRPLLSLGVTLQRYRATCQRLQLRPLNCLLDQLGTMDDGRKTFQDRLDCLKIINEKLDLKHIDAIEEILSRCRFHTLDFESTTIDDLALSQLFDVIEYYESCTHINLSNHRSIGFQGYQSLAKYLRKTNCLERLDMNSMRFDDNSILGFTRSLRLSTTLYELHLESCQLNGKMLQKFIEYLRSCISLRELYLCDNRLQVQDSLLINDLIRTCGKFLYLLDLRSNSLQDNGMSHLASQFSQYDEHHINENHLHKISFQSNQLTQQGIGFLAKSLLHNRTIHSLNLSNNNITNEGLFLLRDALLTNRTITELILRNCRLTDQAAIALAEYIAESSTIQYIDLRENAIQASGICGMAIAIRNNKSLLQLDFDPISSTPTNFSSLLKTNNIDGTTNSNSLLSLTSLRRMTTSFSSFTGSTPFQSTTSGGGGTRELLEQKERWMNDIAAICQRNALIYQEKLRIQEEGRNNPTINGTQQVSTIVKPEDIELKDQTSPVTRDVKEIDQSLETSVDDNDEIKPLPTLPIDNNDETEQSTDTPVNEDTKIESPPPPTLPTDNTEQSTETPANEDTNIEPPPPPILPTDNTDESTNTVANEDTNIEPPPQTLPTDNADEVEQSTDILANEDTNIEPPPAADSVDSELNDDHPDQSLSDDDINNDDKRKFRHSDSIHLLRKKVKNEDSNTSDDESELSSIDEQMVDGV